MQALTCLGCDGQRLQWLEPTEEEMTIRRVGNRVTVRVPPPPICLDCGGTAHHYAPWKGTS
jgi:hypothetical protein